MPDSGPGEEMKTSAFLQSLQYYPIDFTTARLAGTLKYEYGKKGKNLNIADTTIAAVAIQHRLPTHYRQ